MGQKHDETAKGYFSHENTEPDALIWLVMCYQTNLKFCLANIFSSVFNRTSRFCFESAAFTALLTYHIVSYIPTFPCHHANEAARFHHLTIGPKTVLSHLCCHGHGKKEIQRQ